MSWGSKSSLCIRGPSTHEALSWEEAGSLGIFTKAVPIPPVFSRKIGVLSGFPDPPLTGFWRFVQCCHPPEVGAVGTGSGQSPRMSDLRCHVTPERAETQDIAGAEHWIQRCGLRSLGRQIETRRWGDARSIFLTPASKFNVEPSSAIFDASPKTTARQPM